MTHPLPDIATAGPTPVTPRGAERRSSHDHHLGASPLLLAITTVLSTVAIVGLVALGVKALSSGGGTRIDQTGVELAPRPVARTAGYGCLTVSGLLVLYGLYLITPQLL